LEIRDAVLTELKTLGQVSHIRYALAKLGRRGRDGFADARDFRRWLHQEYPSVRSDIPPAELSLVIDARTGNRERFSRDRVKESALAALAGRGNAAQLDRHASNITNEVVAALITQPVVTTGQVTSELLRALRRWDDIGYLRFAGERKPKHVLFPTKSEGRQRLSAKEGNDRQWASPRLVLS
jgi:transcriptional regulator NrdR family protein